MEILLLLVLVFAAWLWLDSISTRETAVINGKELAKRCNLQLLDETVACSKLRIGRNSRGRVQLQRIYQFEVSANGSDRLSCHLVLLGKQLQSWDIPAYQETFH